MANESMLFRMTTFASLSIAAFLVDNTADSLLDALQLFPTAQPFKA